jgi:hypothetical protein
MERLRAIWRCPSSASYFKRKTSLILRMDNLLAGKLTSRWEANLPRDVQRRSPLNACGKHSAEAEHYSARGRLLIAFRMESLIGFAPERVIGFTPES